MVERGAVETFRKCLLVHGRANKEKLERGTMEPWNNGGTMEQRWNRGTVEEVVGNGTQNVSTGHVMQ